MKELFEDLQMLNEQTPSEIPGEIMISKASDGKVFIMVRQGQDKTGFFVGHGDLLKAVKHGGQVKSS